MISLDHTRLLFQSHGESNFLIFYYLVYGGESELKTQLQLDDLSLGEQGTHNFFHFDSSELRSQSKKLFQTVLEALDSLDFKESERKTLFSILAAIVHLGRAGAINTTNQNRHGQFEKPDEAHKAANLIGISYQQLNDYVFGHAGQTNSSTRSTNKYEHLSNNGSSGASPDSSSSALSPTECLEGFCLGLYQENLNLLVNFINKSFKQTQASHSHHQTISNSMLLIDPPGFQYQSFDADREPKHASYADLMCNYLSERLQLMFYQINFINPIEKCAQEGLEIDLVEHIPESPSQLVNWLDKPVAPAILNRTINTIQTSAQLKSPTSSCGLLWLLEEQIGSETKSTTTFLKKLIESDVKRNFISIKNVDLTTSEVANSTSGATFVIHHQFGEFPVEYNLNQWLERYCKEYLMQSNVFALLNESKKDFITATFR